MPIKEKYMDRLEFIESPRYIFFGPGALEKASMILKSLGMTGSIMVVTGGERTSPIAFHLADTLGDEGYESHVFPVRSEIANVRDVESVVDRAKGVKPALLMGVGGGRVIDVAKLSASWLGLKFFSVPTSPSHDGVASPSISFLLVKSVEEAKGKDWARAEAPFSILADTEVIRKAPAGTFKSGFGDLVSKITAVKDWELANKLKDEPYSEYAASMALLSAHIAMDHASEIRPGLEESARIIVKALIGSGVAISIAGSSRPASGSEHLFSHALDLLAKNKGYTNAQHGLQVGLGTIMMAYLQGQDWERIRRKLSEVGAPVTAQEAGIEAEAVVRALTMAHKVRERYTILGESGLTESAANKLAKRTHVI